jgi:hypothetical protein
VADLKMFRLWTEDVHYFIAARSEDEAMRIFEDQFDLFEPGSAYRFDEAPADFEFKSEEDGRVWRADEWLREHPEPHLVGWIE